MVVLTEDNNSVFIDGKRYDELNELSAQRLRYLLQLMEKDIDKYMRPRFYCKDYLELLKDRKKRIQNHLNNRILNNCKEHSL